MAALRSILVSVLSAQCQSDLSLYEESKCFWHVTDQTIMVEAPVLYGYEVEEDCPHEDFGTMHEKICTRCEERDNRCGGEFVACVGCCKLPETARYHTCSSIKKYFFERNSNNVTCDARMGEKDGKMKVQMGQETTQRKDAGTLKAVCEVPVDKKKTQDKVPVKLKFDCNNCAAEGVPHLLKQCCDKAASFGSSQMVQELESDGFTVFLWADGCHSNWIGPKNNRQKFQHTYPALIESKIDVDMKSFIDKYYCSKAINKTSDSCTGTGYPRRLENLQSNPTIWPAIAQNLSRLLAEKAVPGDSEEAVPGGPEKAVPGGPGCEWLKDDEVPSTAATAPAATPPNSLGSLGTGDFADSAASMKFPILAFLGGLASYSCF